MIRTWNLYWVTVLALGCGRGSAGQAVCLKYEPTAVELEGTLETVEHFGPPNYGEDTTRDARLKVPILKLRSPVDVCGDSTSALYSQSFRGITEVQLIMPEGTAVPLELVNQRVKVSGTLFSAISGHHFTDVLATVKAITASR